MGIVAMALLAPAVASAQEIDTAMATDVYEMSLEDLMNVQVSTGSLVSTGQFMTPSSVTVITAEDIERSVYRNMLDLLESYVPGLFYMEHPSEGSKIGMRGIISDRNLKLMLLVNGININDKGHRGVQASLNLWDLSDIEKIEIIRGPGSVTYGPGAIQGVISITTKKASDESYTKVGANYVSDYNSKGFNFSQNTVSKKTNVKSLVYGSIQQTEGYDANVFKVYDAKRYGYAGEVMNKNGTATEPITNPYLKDVDNKPQIKLNADVDFGKDWHFFSTYMQSSFTSSFSPQLGNLASVRPTTVYSTDLHPSTVQSSQQFASSLSKKFTINDRFAVAAHIIYDNENDISKVYRTPSYKSVDSMDVRFISSVNNKNDLRNYLFNFSEQQVTAKTIGYYNSANEKFDAAIGCDVTHNKWSAPWGEASSRIRMGDLQNMVSDNTPITVPDAYASDGWIKAAGKPKGAILIGNGWTSVTYSAYGETKYTFSPLMTVLLSGRVDKDTYSDFLYSPRLTFMSQITDHNFVRFSIMQSNRMNTAEQMYFADLTDKDMPHEKLQSAEILYTYVHNAKLSADFAAYYNINEVLSWAGNLEMVTATGTSKTVGFEPTITYRDKKFQFGINHAIVKLLSWELADGVNGSGISASKFDRKVQYNGKDSVLVSGRGNKLDNYAQQITKVQASYALFKERLILHANTRILWGYDGNMDMVHALQSALDTVTSPIKSDFDALVKKLEEDKAYGIDMRLNVSITYKVLSGLQVTAYCQNLYSVGARRYYYNSNSITSYSSIGRISPYVEEPRVVGARVAYTF